MKRRAAQVVVSRSSTSAAMWTWTVVGAVIVAATIGASACKKAAGDFEGEIAMRIARPGAAASEMTFQTSGGQARLDLGAEGTHAIVRRDGMGVLVVDAQKAWSDLDMAKTSAAMAAADPAGAPTVTKSGKHETIAGQDCETWSVAHTSGKRTEACISEGLVGFDLGALMPGGGAPGVAKDEAKQKKLFPLRSIEYDATGKETSRMEVVRVDRKAIDKARFEVPADYTYVKRP